MIDNLLRTNHGVISTAQLVQIGLSTWDIHRLVTSDALSRLRPGWFAGPTAHQEVRRAVRLGGALTCISALKLHELWTPPFQDLHFRRSLHRQRKSHTPSPCRPNGPELPVHRSVDPIGVALLAAARCRPTPDAVVLLDSALNLRKITEADLIELFTGQPACRRRLLTLIDAAESGIETYIRLRLRSRGIRVQPQVEIPHVGRVDFLVGARLVIEADSRAHHDHPDSYHRDRLRDRTLRTMGFHVVRLTFADVMTPMLWASAEADLLAQVRRRDHYWPRRRSAREDSRRHGEIIGLDQDHRDYPHDLGLGC